MGISYSLLCGAVSSYREQMTSVRADLCPRCMGTTSHSYLSILWWSLKYICSSISVNIRLPIVKVDLGTLVMCCVACIK